MLYVTTLLSTIRRNIEFAEQFQRGMTGIERFCEIMDADVDLSLIHICYLPKRRRPPSVL